MSLMLRRGRDAVLICAYLCDTCGAETSGRDAWHRACAAAELLGWMTLPRLRGRTGSRT